MIQEILESINKDKYSKVRPYIKRLKDGDSSTFQPICEAIKQAFELRDPEQMLYAARLGKESVETKNPDFLELFQMMCLPLYEKIASFRYDDHDYYRGKYYFSSAPDDNLKTNGASLLILILESIYVWALQFPSKDKLPTPFYLTYLRLKKIGVTFPSQSHYYQKGQVFRFPEPQKIIISKQLQQFKQMLMQQTFEPLVLINITQIVKELNQINVELINLQESIKNILSYCEDLQAGQLSHTKYQQYIVKKIEDLEGVNYYNIVLHYSELSLCYIQLQEYEEKLDFFKQNSLDNNLEEQKLQKISDDKQKMQNNNEIVQDFDVKFQILQSQNDDLNNQIALLKAQNQQIMQENNTNRTKLQDQANQILEKQKKLKTQQSELLREIEKLKQKDEFEFL